MQPLAENTVNTPAFLGKLWKMVNDPSTDHLICWSPSGTSFIIQNQAQFWYELLPLYYKHNNMSSFVRQLNMYGFHKMSTVENGTMDADKDEIQFTHPYFQKDQPELLRNIKRKATPSKTTIENSNKHDELAKVLTDVKQLRGRQANVDSQLNAMKQENALLWREVAILRQKHIKQQKIVNKLIQFLVTLVQPSRMTVGVKRGYQLMLNESPIKKTKIDINKGKNKNNAEGPTIHELDNELELSPNLYEEDTPLDEDSNPAELRNETIDSPAASQQNEANSPLSTTLLDEDNGDSSSQAYWDKPEFVDIGEPSDLIDNNDIVEENLMNTLENEPLSPTTTTTTATTTNVNDKVFLNPTTQDTLLSNLIKTNSPSKDKKNKKDVDKDDALDKFSSPPQTSSDSNMAIATRNQNLVDIIKSEDLSNHVDSTQSELDQFKDILNNYNSYVDANALLGELNKIPLNFSQVNLFSDHSPPVYDLNNDDKHENFIDTGADPLVSGSELTPYNTNFDFTELFDDAVDGENTTTATTATTNTTTSTVNTPQILKNELLFPTITKSEKK